MTGNAPMLLYKFSSSSPIKIYPMKLSKLSYMAALRALPGPSSSSATSSSNSQESHHVFLSFRGNDNGRRFTDHLYAALNWSGIRAFRDDERIHINRDIRNAIEESKVSLIVLSKDYASSIRCLDVLVMIMEHRTSDRRHTVIPIFYDVKPSEIAEQTGSFAEAFDRHRQHFTEARVDKWKEALTQDVEIGGHVLGDRHEAKFIHAIVETVTQSLNHVRLILPLHLVGMDTRLQGINSWLKDCSDDFSIGMICGIGGVGKTTLAKIAFILNYENFDSFSFLEVRAKVEQDNNGLVMLQRKLLSDILKEKAEEIYNKDEGTAMIREAIKRRKALIVLDDVDDNEQLAEFIGEWDILHSKGSKIIITTRQDWLLGSHAPYKKFEVQPLDENESLELFDLHAFPTGIPSSISMENSKNIVGLCGGLPLALEVLGSALSGNSRLSMDELRRTLETEEETEGENVQRTLRTSYNSLQEPRDKNLFLDIACFYIGKKKYQVDKVVEDCELYRALGFQTLIDRHLVTVDEDNRLTMHQLLRDMGRKIAEQKSTESEKHRRIWNSEDALKVLRENTGTDRIRSLILDKQQLNLTPTNELNVGIEGFATMRNLKLLHLNNVKFNRGHKKFARSLRWVWRYASPLNAKLNGGGYKSFPTRLIWLSWHGFPLQFITNAFSLEELVVLDMRNSSLQYVWKGPKFLPNLKILNLSHSHLLVTFPDCTKLPNLELLILKGCLNLVEIDKSIGSLEKLMLLNLKGCKKLKQLPREIARIKSLEELLLSGCSELHEIPEELVELNSLKVFDASGTAINQASSLSQLHSTEFSLAILPRFLTVLRLKDCNLLDDVIPMDLSRLCSLMMLELSGNPIQTLPESIVSLTLLQFLSLERCRRLQFLPELPAGLRGLNLVSCKSLEKLKGELWTEKESVGINGCANMLEIEGLYKLQKMTDFDKMMMDLLHLFNLKALESSFEVEMINCQTESMLTEKFQMPVLHECGITSFFFSGSEIPSWYWYQTHLQLFKFRMPHVEGNRLTGLNLCVVYAFDSSKIDSFHPIVKDKYDGSFSFVIIITNITKGLAWFYRPAFFAKPETDVNMTWLSHWNFWDQLQGGDEIQVRVTGSFAFRVKKVGIDSVLEESMLSGYVDTSPYVVRPGQFQPVEFRFDHSRRGPVGPKPFRYLANRSPYEVMPGENRRGSTSPPIYFHLNHYPDD